MLEINLIESRPVERVRKPESTLILSGFPSSDIPEGFQAKETLRREDWVCLIC